MVIASVYLAVAHAGAGGQGLTWPYTVLEQHSELFFLCCIDSGCMGATRRASILLLYLIHHLIYRIHTPCRYFCFELCTPELRFNVSVGC